METSLMDEKVIKLSNKSGVLPKNPEDVTPQQDFRQLNRGSWKNKTEYLLSMVGYAVGLGNAWRFPYIAYQNGGGAFLIPYLVMLLCAGLPLFLLETALGQFCGQSSFEAFNCIPLLKGIGVTVVLNSVYIGIFYAVIIAYAAHYFFLSFQNPLPWISCKHENSDPHCSELTAITGLNASFAESPLAETSVTQNLTGFTAAETSRISSSENYWLNIVLSISSGVEDPGKVRWALCAELLLVWVIIFLCTMKGVKSVGKVVYFTALFPYVVLTILLFASLRLDGAFDGIKFFFQPTWGKIFEAKVWQEAATQIFFSLSACIGGLIALSSYNDFHNNCYRDALIVAAVNSFTSLYAAITIFATLGFMAKKLNVNIQNVVKSGPGLAFVVYPQAVAQLPLPQLWSALFFIMLVTLGFDTMFAIVETVTTLIADAWPHFFHTRKAWLNLVTCSVYFLLGIMIVTEGGFYWLTLLDTYVSGYAILFASVIELCAVVYFYGVTNFMLDIEMMIGVKLHNIWKIVWTYVTPVIMLVITISTLAQLKPLTLGDDYTFPPWSEAFGWLMVVSCLIWVPGYAIYDMSYHQGSFIERLKISLKPNKLWRPFSDKNCTGRYAWAVAEGNVLNEGLDQGSQVNEGFSPGPENNDDFGTGPGFAPERTSTTNAPENTFNGIKPENMFTTNADEHNTSTL